VTRRVLAAALLGAVAFPAGALAHGAAVPPSQLASTWRLDWAPVLAAVLALALFGQAFVRLRRRGRCDHAPWWRAVLYLLGVLAITLALVSPLDALGDDYLLSAHMIQHGLLLDVGPALVLLGLRGPLLFFLLPPAVLGPLARARPLRRLLHLLLRPLVSFAVWTGVLLAWHVPAVYDYALDHRAVHDLEHASYLLIGLLVWAQLLDPARRRRLGVGGRAFYAAALFGTGHVLLHPVLFAAGVLYPSYAVQPHRVFGWSALADQHYAAFAMTADQVLTLGVFVVLLLWRRPATAADAPDAALGPAG